MGRIIRNGIEYGNGSTFSVVYLTQEEYDTLPESKLTDGVEYRITDNNPTTPSAKNMAYDGTASGLEVNNVQDAIDTVNNNLNGTVLWTNPNHTSTFAAQTITLNDNVENYKHIECIFKRANNESYPCYTTGKLPIPTMIIYFGFYCFNSSRATGGIVSGNKITFKDATMQMAYGSEITTDNKWAIPYQIIGYK